MVGKALVEHYIDGTNMMRMCMLTSAVYVPPPRNDVLVGTGSRRLVYKYEKQRIFDAHPLIWDCLNIRGSRCRGERIAMAVAATMRMRMRKSWADDEGAFKRL